MKNIKDLESLEVKSKKKKNFIIIWVILFIVGILLFSFIGTLLSVKKEKIYKNSQREYKDLEVIKNPEFKENWAISMENRVKKQEQRMAEIIDLVKNQQNSVVSELKNVITENNEKLKTQLQLMKDANEFKINEIKTSLEKKIAQQDERLSNLKEILFDKIEETKNENLARDLVIGKNTNYKIPTKENTDKNVTIVNVVNTDNKNKTNKTNKTNVLDNNTTSSDLNSKKNNNSEKNLGSKEDNESLKNVDTNATKRVKLSVINIDTSFNQKIIKIKNKQAKTTEKLNSEIETKKTYHVSTGFMKAYMITGAYAPVFEEGSMEPLPVLFEIDGSILMSNNVKGSLNKCYLLGSAKGKMNSETADIKLVSISCLTDGGKYRLEGSISGWVIGENGNPGLQGEMIHKNGAWLARTFVSGFFSTFSQALAGNGGSTPIVLSPTNGTTDTTSTTQAVSSNFAQAGASGISDVFSKLGDYYLKMAEQIFPIIEVKPGRTISILLIGGEDFELKDNNTIDTEKMEENANKVKSQKKQSVINNAFTETIINDSIENSSTNEGNINAVENTSGKKDATNSASSNTDDNFDFNF